MNSLGLDGVENFHTINASFDAATATALLLIATYTTGIETVLAEII